MSSDKRQGFAAKTVQYTTKLVRGSFLVTDRELRNNIDGESLDEKMLAIVVKKVANDYEKAAIYSRDVSTAGGTAGSIMHMFNGFLANAKANGHVTSATDFDDRLVARDKFRKAVKALPTKYRSNAQIIVSDDVMMDYEDQYVTVADFRVKDDISSRIASKSTIVAPLMSNEEAVLVSGGASTTASAAALGATQITVASATGLTVGKAISINHGTVLEQNRTITAVSGTTITLDGELTLAIADSSTVKEVTLDGSSALITSPDNLIWVQQMGAGSMQFEIERVASVGRLYHYVGSVDFMVANAAATGVLTDLQVA